MCNIAYTTGFMSHTIDEPIIEGFICPNCMSVFRTAEILRIHFKKEHLTKPTVSKPTDAFKSAISVAHVTSDSPNYAFFEQGVKNQPLGCTRSLIAELKQWRTSHITKAAVQMNTMLIRLEKLLCLPPMKATERREAEQTIVPWITAKVDLCPSCGKRFGLGVEEAFPELSTAESNPTASADTKLSFAKLSKRTLALLDYNPVFRRRHHCRLCGHVLCADCSYFVDRASAARLMKSVDRYNLNRALTHAPDSSQSPALDEQPIMFERDVSSNLLPVDLDREPCVSSHWRICKVCRDILEKKAACFTSRQDVLPLVQLHTKLKNLMNKVNESMPCYRTIANSLHSGEQRYDLEMAKSMRHELLESLQQIDALRKQLELLESGQHRNLALTRVLRAIGNMTRQFLQLNLPPLRALPTVRQYGSLTAQRQDELAARWEQEDRAIHELEKCLRDSDRTTISRVHSSDSLRRRTQHGTAVRVEDLNELARRIDEASAGLMHAKRSANHQQIVRWTSKLEELEKQFQTKSQQLQSFHF